MTDPKGNAWTYTYDVQGNRLTASDPDAGATTFTTTSYDIVGGATKPGLLASSSRWVNGAEIKATVNSYDTAGRPTSSTMSVPAITNLIPSGLAGNYTTTNSYNPDGSLATSGLPVTGPVAAETLTFGYSTKGMPVSMTGMAAIIQSTAYTQWDTVSSVTMGSVSGKSLAMLISRDEATLRLSRIRTNRQITGIDEDTVYSYDNVGNVIGAKATLLSGKVDNQCFQYDYQGQLKQAFTAAAATVCSGATTPVMDTTGPAAYWSTWATDTVGKTGQRVDRSSVGTSTTVLTYPANGGVRPHTVSSAVTTGVGAVSRSYSYDAAGNTTGRPSPAGVAQALTYNDEGRLSHIDAGGTGVFDAVYDAAGARIVKREGGKTTLTVAGTDLSVDNATGVLSASRYYAWQGMTVGVRTGNTAALLWSVVTDHQNSSHHQVRNSDSLLTTSWQGPFGGQRGTAPTGWIGLKGFVGGTRDGTGLVRLGARDYDPVLNRFTTVDPVQVLTDPLQWNSYLYADNSPVTLSDPSGLYIPGDKPGEFYFPTAKKDKHGKTKWYSTLTFQKKVARSSHRAARTRSRASFVAISRHLV